MSGPGADHERGLDLAAVAAAAVRRASRAISPDDGMHAGNDEHYYSVATSALRAVLAGLATAGTTEVRNVLDLGSGHGRVLRALRAQWPGARIVAADILPGAVEFCARELGATGLVVPADAEDLQLPGDNQLLWCGSVLTHLDRPRWITVLRAVSHALDQGGVGVLTTHGRRMAWRASTGADYGLPESSQAQLLATYRACGFAYVDYPLQEDYGISLTSPSAVLDIVGLLPDLRVVSYTESGWDDHQDVLTVLKDSRAHERGRR